MFSNITTVHACVKVIQTKHLELDDLNEKKLKSSRYYPEPSQKKNNMQEYASVTILFIDI